ncbi:MAG: nucleotidyltransferase family protein [Burkholderiaceae bacterium]|nr:MAG: nucleotidyltransferase family protein [Burkholderiaceae bacterium]
MSAADRPVVLVLASGRGERFRASGGQVHKLRALLEGREVLERTLDAVRASGLPWHLEDQGLPGMGDSIAAAVRATPNTAGWLVLPGDLPLVQPETLRTVAEALRSCAVAVPVYQGQRGHPVGFSAACGAELGRLSGEQGAASVVREQARLGGLRLVTVEDQGTVVDVDTVQALAQAAALLRARAAQH